MLNLFLTVCFSAQMQDCHVYRLPEVPTSEQQVALQTLAAEAAPKVQLMEADEQALYRWSRHTRAKPGVTVLDGKEVLQSRFRN